MKEDVVITTQEK